MKYLISFNESVKDDVQILYKSKDLVCMIPKTWKASVTYGRKTTWCQSNPESCLGFDEWSSKGLLIRFLFKDGSKIRMTYFTDKRENCDFYWAIDKTPYHLLKGSGKDPFDVLPKESSKMEVELYNKMSKIPDECRKNVVEFISNNDFKYTEDKPTKPNQAQIKSFHKLVSWVNKKWSICKYDKSAGFGTWKAHNPLVCWSGIIKIRLFTESKFGVIDVQILPDGRIVRHNISTHQYPEKIYINNKEDLYDN